MRNGLLKCVQWDIETRGAKDLMFKTFGKKVKYFPHTKRLLLTVAEEIPADLVNEIEAQPAQRVPVKHGNYVIQTQYGLAVMSQSQIDEAYPDVIDEEAARREEQERITAMELKKAIEERRLADAAELEAFRKAANEAKNKGNGKADEPNKTDKKASSGRSRK